MFELLSESGDRLLGVREEVTRRNLRGRQVRPVLSLRSYRVTERVDVAVAEKRPST